MTMPMAKALGYTDVEDSKGTAVFVKLSRHQSFDNCFIMPLFNSHLNMIGVILYDGTKFTTIRAYKLTHERYIAYTTNTLTRDSSKLYIATSYVDYLFFALVSSRYKQFWNVNIMCMCNNNFVEAISCMDMDNKIFLMNGSDISKQNASVFHKLLCKHPKKCFILKEPMTAVSVLDILMLKDVETLTRCTNDKLFYRRAKGPVSVYYSQSELAEIFKYRDVNKYEVTSNKYFSYRVSSAVRIKMFEYGYVYIDDTEDPDIFDVTLYSTRNMQRMCNISKYKTFKTSIHKFKLHRKAFKSRFIFNKAITNQKLDIENKFKLLAWFDTCDILEELKIITKYLKGRLG